jgi:hypothetical protein
LKGLGSVKLWRLSLPRFLPLAFRFPERKGDQAADDEADADAHYQPE